MATDAELEALESSILLNASGPQRMRTDEGEAEQHPLDKQLQVLDQLSGASASRHRRRGLLMSKIVPPGAN